MTIPCALKMDTTLLTQQKASSTEILFEMAGKKILYTKPYNAVTTPHMEEDGKKEKWDVRNGTSHLTIR